MGNLLYEDAVKKTVLNSWTHAYRQEYECFHVGKLCIVLCRVKTMRLGRTNVVTLTRRLRDRRAVEIDCLKRRKVKEKKKRSTGRVTNGA